MSMVDAPDATLISDTLAGDERAFAELVRRYQSAVWGTVHRILGKTYDCEDAVQEVFLRAFTSLRRFDSRYPFGPWILRIAANYCIDQLRRKKSRKIQLWSELREGEQERLLKDMSHNGDFSAMANAGAENYDRIAQTLLDGLRPKLKAAFVLREVDGRDYNEVAKALGTSELTARVRVSRARAEIQKRYKRCLASTGWRELL